MPRTAKPEVWSQAVAPDLKNLPEARDFVRQAAGRAGFGDERTFDITVACSEAMANAIEHAEGGEDIILETSVYPDRLDVAVRGTGRFEVPERLAERQHRGLGLPLMAKFSDHLALYSAPQGGTLLTLTFYRAGHDGARADSPLPPGLLELFESSDRLETVFDAMGQGFAIFDTDWRCVYVNHTLATHQGLARDDLRGQILASRERAASPFLSLLAEAKERGGEVHGEHVDLERGRCLELTAFPFAGGVALLSRDVTGVREAERERERARRRSALVAETAAKLLTSSDPQSLVEELCSKVMEELGCHVFFNFLVDEEAGQLFLNACSGIPAEEAAAIRWLAYGVAVCGCAAQQGERIIAEDIPANPDPRTDLVASYGVQAYACHPLLYEDRVLGTLSFGSRTATRFGDDQIELMRTVADLVAVAMARIQTERDLRRSETRFRSLFESGPNAMLLLDADGKVRAANAAASELLGRPERTLSSSLEETLGESAPDMEALLEQCRAQSRPRRAQLTATRHDGVLVPMEVDARTFDEDTGQVLVTLRDVSERRRLETELKQREEQARYILASAPAAVYEIDFRVPRFVEVNDLVCRLSGYSREELLATNPFDLLDEESRERFGKRLRSALAGDPPEEQVDYTVVTKDGRRVTAVLNVSFVYAEGVPVGAVVVGHDVTERVRREAATRFLAQVADDLARVAGEEELLAVTASRLAAFLGLSRCQIAETDDRLGAVLKTHEWHAEGRPAMSVEQMGRLYTVFRPQLRRRAADREPVVVDDSRLRAPHEAALLEELGIGACVVAARVEEGRFGFAIGAVSEAPRAWREDEIRLLGEVAERIWLRLERARAEAALRESEQQYRALAAENERLYRQQLNIAESLQRALLQIPSAIGRARMGHLYRSATETARVGGDFYDVFEVKDGKIGVLIGDVAGHGIEAARTALMVKDVVHAFTHQSLRTHEVLRRTNNLLVEKDLPGFVTVFLGILYPESGELRYSSAGHPESMLRRATGDVELLGLGSSPLGIYPGASWKTYEVEMQADDLLLLYTDGVIEARRDAEFFGIERLRKLAQRKRVPVERLPELILERVLEFSGGALTDDAAILALTLEAGRLP